MKTIRQILLSGFSEVDLSKTAKQFLIEAPQDMKGPWTPKSFECKSRPNFWDPEETEFVVTGPHPGHGRVVDLGVGKTEDEAWETAAANVILPETQD